MKSLRIVFAAAMAMMMVSGAFAQEFTMGGRADYELEYSSTEVGDADAVNAIKLGDGGRVQFIGTASKELDNGATVEASGTLHLETGGPEVDSTKIKYMNGPLTVIMLKADRPGFMDQGLDIYVPQDPLYKGEWTNERSLSVEYAGESTKFVTTLNLRGDEKISITPVNSDGVTGDPVDYDANNTIAIHPYIEVGAGSVTIKGLVEYIGTFRQNTDDDGPSLTIFGGGVGIDAALGAMTVGLSGGYGLITGTNEKGNDLLDNGQMSMYAYMKMDAAAGTVGLAGGYNMQTIDEVDEDLTGYQVNAAFERGDVIVPGLKLGIAVGYSFIDDHKKVETTKTGGKMRLRYEF